MGTRSDLDPDVDVTPDPSGRAGAPDRTDADRSDADRSDVAGGPVLIEERRSGGVRIRRLPYADRMGSPLGQGPDRSRRPARSRPANRTDRAL
jgi:hypothetical protein